MSTMSSEPQRLSATAEEPATGALPPLADPERMLALAYAPEAVRPALHALWALDEQFGTVVATTREPQIGVMRLVWWRDALETLDQAPAPAEPLLAELAASTLDAGVSGATLAGMEEGWTALLESDPPEEKAIEDHARIRGAGMFETSATLLGGAHGIDIAAAGEAWAFADLARRLSNARARDCAIMLGRARLPRMGAPWPRSLRPIGMLAVLAGSELRAGSAGRRGSPRRVFRAALHGLTGR